MGVTRTYGLKWGIKYGIKCGAAARVEHNLVVEYNHVARSRGLNPQNIGKVVGRKLQLRFGGGRRQGRLLQLEVTDLLLGVVLKQGEILRFQVDYRLAFPIGGHYTEQDQAPGHLQSRE